MKARKETQVRRKHQRLKLMPTQIIAIVKRYERAGKTVFVDALSSRLYRARRTLTYPIRRVARGLRRRVRVLLGGDRHA